MKHSERGDVNTVVIIALIAMAVVIIIAYVVAIIAMRDRCREYENTPISEVPAKCINWRGGTY